MLAEDAAARLPSAAHPNLARLLRAWLEADRNWKPSTWVGYRSVARFLADDSRSDVLPASLHSWPVLGAVCGVVVGVG
ncbi:hypothetical protein [Nocardioides alcanivorans]|uniref:hypothetical protein n=1 Tax=Nocardioides alcanivorans TaxID=2897352 RepID=UPI001F4103C3|nr:hypothetical protein [Nocardioides alcanivorans]